MRARANMANHRQSRAGNVPSLLFRSRSGARDRDPAPRRADGLDEGVSRRKGAGDPVGGGRMKERPILFSTPMVQAILEGRKTQTRRIVKQSPIAAGLDWSLWYDEKLDAQLNQRQFAQLHCPYGKPGDRLWVRENFRLSADQDDKPPSQDYWKSGAWYAADSEGEPSGCAGGAGRLRSAIH